MRHLLLLATFIIGGFQILWSQETLKLSLEETIRLAQSDAPDALIAKTILDFSYWNFQRFNADLRPQIDLEATVPNLNRSIESITLQDGSDIFINRSLLRNSLGINLSQVIPATGGRIFASTSLDRLDILKTSTNPEALSSYLSNPIRVTLIQPLFGYNDLKWEKQIEPLRYQESQREYSENLESVSYEAAGYFFRVLDAQLGVVSARLDKQNADTLFAIGKGRFGVGKIAETDVLQLELRSMETDAQLAKAQLDLATSTEQLRDYLGITIPVIFDLISPEAIPDFKIDENEALQYSQQNRSVILRHRREAIEADQEIARAKGNAGQNVNLIGSFGLSQTGKELKRAYKSPEDQERLSLSLTVPIADWGKADARKQIAKSNKELSEREIAREKINFNQEILIKVRQFDLVRDQVDLSKRSFETADKRLNLSRSRYMVAKIDVTDLNLAISARENARQAYFNSLRDFWLAYYDIRGLTLYDFWKGQSLIK